MTAPGREGDDDAGPGSEDTDGVDRADRGASDPNTGASDAAPVADGGASADAGADPDPGASTETAPSPTATPGVDRTAADRDPAAGGAGPESEGDGSGPVESADDRPGDPVRERVDRDTERWRGVSLVALLLGGVGVLVGRPALLLAAAVGVGYVAYARATRVGPVALSVDRELSDREPDPGEEVTVSLTVANEGDRTLWDLRVVDGVPPALPVVEGVPRVGATLRPGESVTVDYDVRAKRGDHAFAETLVAVRDPSGATERELRVATDDHLVATPAAAPTREVPLRSLTARYTGRVETDEGGEGVEFHATREYRPGDSLSRIDWNRHARTGELSTVEFREERAATAVLVPDVRPAAYLRADREALHAADRGVTAAAAVLSTLLATGDRVGIAALADEDVWLPPGSGNDHRARARELLATHPALSPVDPDDRVPVSLRVRRLRQRLPAEAQVILFSPLGDDAVVRAARLLDAHGHLVTVVSPDPTSQETPGQALATAERQARMADLRGVGVRVVDWGREETLAAAIDRAERRWST